MNLKDEFLRLILLNLERTNPDEYMNLCYNVLIGLPKDVIDFDKATAHFKVEHIDRLIKHFEEKEQFEKCQQLKEIREKIKLRS